ncbi:hypothetical protein D3C73_848860 [compost metagenome]
MPLPRVLPSHHAVDVRGNPAIDPDFLIIKRQIQLVVDAADGDIDRIVKHCRMIMVPGGLFPVRIAESDMNQAFLFPHPQLLDIVPSRSGGNITSAGFDARYLRMGVEGFQQCREVVRLALPRRRA